MTYRPDYPKPTHAGPFPAGDIQRTDPAYDQTFVWLDSMILPLTKRGRQRKAGKMIAEVQDDWRENSLPEERIVHGRALKLTNNLDAISPGADDSVTRGYLGAHSMALAIGILEPNYHPSLYESIADLQQGLITNQRRQEAFTKAAWSGMYHSHDNLHALMSRLNRNLGDIYNLVGAQDKRQRLGIGLFYILTAHGHLLTSMPEYPALKQPAERQKDADLESLVINDENAAYRRPL